MILSHQLKALREFIEARSEAFVVIEQGDPVDSFIAEAMNLLNEDEELCYAMHLAEIVRGYTGSELPGWNTTIRMLRATSCQRLEAILKATGSWVKELPESQVKLIEKLTI